MLVKSLNGKIILVTGASSDLGSSVAYACAESGASVILLDRKQHNMTSIYDSISEIAENPPLMVEFDLLKSDSSQFDLLAKALAEQYSAIDGLAHCAMWGAPLTPVIHSSLETWNSILNQQLTRPMFLTKTLLSLINQSDNGRIIFPVLNVGRNAKAYWGAVGCGFAGIENLCGIINEENEDAGTRAFSLGCDNIKTAVRKKFYPAATDDQLLKPSDHKVTGKFIELLTASHTELIQHNID